MRGMDKHSYDDYKWTIGIGRHEIIIGLVDNTAKYIFHHHGFRYLLRKHDSCNTVGYLKLYYITGIFKYTSDMVYR